MSEESGGRELAGLADVRLLVSDELGVSGAAAAVLRSRGWVGREKGKCISRGRSNGHAVR